MPIISVKNISKTFVYYKKAEGLSGAFKSLFKREKLKKHAVDNVSFDIDKGEFVGFLGSNGAGKTTTLKMLSGILYPTSGSINVVGYDPSKRQNEYKKQIAIVMGQKSQLSPVLPAMETYVLFQKIYEINENTYRKRLNFLADLLNVKDILKVQVRKLSLGQRMKCELIASLLHNPKVLFLDEPTIGLDIISQKKIREFLREYNERFKTTIMLTSHYMDDVQNLCKRLIIINDGQIGYDGPIEKIIAEYSKDKILHVVFDKKVFQKDLKKIGKIMDYTPYEVNLSLPLESSRKKIRELMVKFPIKDITISDVTLEEVVADMFEKTLN